MLRTAVLSIMILIFLTACGSQAEQPVFPTETPVPPPTRTPEPTLTPRQLASPTPTATEVSSPGSEPTSVPLPDLSGVELYEVTHLMDPRLFQVSMDGWPTDLSDDLVVRVGMEIYTCDVLFPERFPNRVYCWGFAPPRGTEVTLQVILENVAEPLLEIPFTVPYPSNEDS